MTKDTTKSYPKYESHCCGAPVKVKADQELKYYCEACGQPCIARSKK